MKNMLDKISVIKLKYDLIERESKFNVFSILRNSSDEVNLHSKFIYELLSQRGSHKKGKLFLKLFLEALGNTEFDTEKIIVTRERWQIDILIRNTKSQAIIIENKIWADDQDDQLFKYYEKIKQKGFNDIKIYYLTPFGHEPSEKSIKKLPKYVREKSLTNISYSFQIIDWLEKSIEKSSQSPLIRESLIQYKNLINKLTGNSMTNNLKDDIIELLAQENNIINAQKIASNWAHINRFTEWKFWEELEKKIENDYKILKASKYNEQYLNSVYNRSRNRDPWYGVMGEIYKYGAYSICIYFERGWDNMYYGITIVKDGKRIKTEEFKSRYPDLSKKIEDIEAEHNNDWWLGYTYIEQQINFTAFSNEETLKIINDQFRKSLVDEIWSSVINYAHEVEYEIKGGTEQVI